LGALTVRDVRTREAAAIEVRQRLRGENVVAALDRIPGGGFKPKCFVVDDASELSRRLLDLCAYHRWARSDFGCPASAGHLPDRAATTMMFDLIALAWI